MRVWVSINEKLLDEDSQFAVDTEKSGHQAEAEALLPRAGDHIRGSFRLDGGQ